ncbi:MAG TPA: glycosyltransferase family 2 protein [Candidatus Nitrosocosmicus sp.]|nr:glycosyltransferase family 2 protein [Candidatus Nitrosocosmicus sp.]
MTKKDFLLSIIIPVYNEEDGIDPLMSRIIPVLNAYNYELIFVDDGSKDKTFQKLKGYTSKNDRIKVISFVRNFGHQMALSAGYAQAKGDAVVSIDADLQDPPELITQMVEEWQKGYQVIYAQREERDDSFFKKQTASIFYKLINFLSDTPIPHDVGDYRLLDREVVDFLNKLPERKDFLRGIVAWGGYKSTKILFKRDRRETGKTHYPLAKMLDLALNGITSFSIKPLRMVTFFGLLVSLFSIVEIAYKVIEHILFPEIYWQPGWASLFFAIVFLGGVQLMTIGIIGEYIGKIYRQIQSRPHYLIKEKIHV